MASFVAREINAAIESGRVHFTVTDWVEGQSSKGDPMITITCNCVDGNGVSEEVKDHFLLTKKHIFALGVFSKSIGVYDKYLTGSLERQDVVGKKGICLIGLDQDRSPNAADGDWVVKINEYLSACLAPEKYPRATAGKFRYMGD